MSRKISPEDQCTESRIQITRALGYAVHDAYDAFSSTCTVAQQKRLMNKLGRLESDTRAAVIKLLSKHAGRK